MPRDIAPDLRPYSLRDLRPTQMALGYREVARKRAEWHDLHHDDAGQFLGRHAIPVVFGPKGRAYVIDHHHLARALIEAGQGKVLVQPLADLRALAQDEFWHVLGCRNDLYLFDADGQRRSPDDLPKSVADMPDDPYRSLAGDLRRTGGFAKEPTPYAEFLWSDFLRRRIARKRLQRNYDAALAAARVLARSAAANHLPGWCGQED